jgi:hypothetical protein
VTLPTRTSGNLPTHQTEGFQGRTNIYHAQPNADAPGFDFTSYDEYQQKAATQPHVEVYELRFIDGPTGNAQLFAHINQASLERWFEDIEPLSDNEKAAVCFLVDSLDYSVIDALAAVEDVMLLQGGLEAVAAEIFDDLHAATIPAFLLPYFDIAAYARDLETSGELTAFRFNDTDYVVTNANEL